MDEVVHDGRIGQGRGVAKIAEFVFGDLAQDTTHDLAGARLRQVRGELDQVGRSDRTDLFAHPADQLLAQLLGWLFSGHQRHVGVDALSLDVVRVANHGSFRNLWMGDQRRFHFGSAKPVAGDIDHVVDAAGDPVIAVRIAAAAITGEIRLHETLVIAVDRAHHARPSLGNTEIAAGFAFLHFALGVNDLRHDAEERQRRRARLETNCAGQRRDQNAAGFGLPPRVDDWAAAVAYDTVVPFPGFGIDWFANRA